MAFNNGVDRLEELRFRDPQSPHNESPLQGYTSRGNGSQVPMMSQSSNDARVSLQRRFTADSTLSPIGQPRGPVAEQLDLSSSTLHKVQLLEKKQAEYEALRERRRKFEAEMQLIDIRQQREEQEMLQMAQDLHINTSAEQSEPATPPEYRDAGFPTSLSRPNRYSASNITSPSTLNTRDSRSSSQMMSPPRDLVQMQYNSPATANKIPSKSVPGSRRNSDERKTERIPETKEANHRLTTGQNRYSMPVNGLHSRGRSEMPGLASVLSLGQINTTGFLFGDDDEKTLTKKEPNLTTSPDVRSYLQINTADDKFPVLLRREGNQGLHLSASSAALDLALSQSPGPESQANGWPPYARHRPAQQSLPLNKITNQEEISSPESGVHQAAATFNFEPSRNARQATRSSMEVQFGPHVEDKRLSQPLITPTSIVQAGPPKLQSSYSTNDIPTMKNASGLTGVGITHNSHAQQHFHNHNASLGRIPPNAVSNRHSRELSGGDNRRDDLVGGFQAFQSGLQGNATPFGPAMSAATTAANIQSAITPSGISPYSLSPYYGGYGMQMMPMGVNNVQVGHQMHMNHQMQMFQPQSIAAYSNYSQYGRYPDSQARVIQQRRMQNGEENARFANIQLEQLQGEIYALCKDQHGCRYLQKKLEERNPDHVHMIFLETNQHVVELMTDPFGNYLCQKLLEYANDEERTVLINNAAPQMIKVALNQHGTRALQKMIEFISTREQIQTIIFALQDRVVELIQDLNGNHVIQKCLNRLSPEDAQFIFNARCIDHASGHQKAQLISQISANAFALVQDPFGNYVVQYILDLNEPAFTDPLCHGFRGQIPALSKQKFSSNVIEKCLRTADPSTKRIMIEEMLNPNELEKMLRDSFANYVVQTAMDYADADTKARLIETIRPILPAIRATPYGRRIQGKIQDRDGRLSAGSSGQITPSDVSSPGQIPLLRQITPGFQQRPSSIQPQNSNFTDQNVNNMGRRYSNSSGGVGVGSSTILPSSSQSQVPGQISIQDQFPSYGRPSQSGNINYF